MHIRTEYLSKPGAAIFLAAENCKKFNVINGTKKFAVREWGIFLIYKIPLNTNPEN